MKKVIAEVAVPVSLALDECFDYRVPASMIPRVAIGSIVIVPLRQKVYRGYVRRLKNKSPFENRLKAILKVLDIPLIDDPDLLALAEKIREDCFCSFADALETILPEGIKRAGRKNTSAVSEAMVRAPGEPVMCSEEETALETIRPETKFLLIRDQLPERRWVFYSALIKKAALEKKSVVVLVPDHEKISWVLDKLRVPQKPILLGSNQKPRETRAAWLGIRNSDSCLVIGTRSAIFAPAKNLGLLIVDEEDHFAYHQEQVPHYHARDIASFRAQKTGARVVFGSLTPSLEIAQRVQGPEGQTIKIERGGPWPAVHLVDLDQTSIFQGKRKTITKTIEYRLAAALDKKESVLIYVSQKGFAGMLYCRHCKKTSNCPRCSVPLKLHKTEQKVACPVCRYTTDIFDLCPECKSSYIKFIGFGAEKIASEIKQLFPSAGCDIMIATQQFLETPASACRPTDLVVILDADTMLSHAGFQTTEQTFAKLLKLASLARKDVYIQTRLRDHYIFEYLKVFDVDGFFRRELSERRELGWPPVVRMGALHIRSRHEKKAREAAEACYGLLKKVSLGNKAGEVLEPAAGSPAKARGSFRYFVLIKTPDLGPYQKTIRDLMKKRPRGAIVTFDPYTT